MKEVTKSSKSSNRAPVAESVFFIWDPDEKINALCLRRSVWKDKKPKLTKIKVGIRKK